MDKVFTSLAVSVDGFITGRGPGPGHGLGDGGILFRWYGDGDTPSRLFPGFRLFEPSRSVFDDLAGRVGAVVAGRNTYDDSDGFDGAGPHPTAPLIVVSHRPAPPEATDKQTFVTTIKLVSRPLAPLLAIGTSRSWAAVSSLPRCAPDCSTR